MLPAQHRLRRRQDFAKVYAKGDRYKGQYLSLRIYATKNSSATTQIGFVISKKVSKKAVHRNRIKRQLRAIFWQLLSQLKQGLQIIVTVYPQQESLEFKKIQGDLTKLLIKAQVLHGN